MSNPPGQVRTNTCTFAYMYYIVYCIEYLHTIMRMEHDMLSCHGGCSYPCLCTDEGKCKASACLLRPMKVCFLVLMAF